MTALWNTIIYQPLYNTLLFIVSVLPGHSVGSAIIILTVLVRLVLLPLTGKSIKAQRAMKELEPELKRIREEHKDDREKQSRKMMELYQAKGVNPFSGCLPLLIQIPIIIGLYWVFFKGLTTIDQSILYAFVHPPETLDMHFLVFDLGAKSMFIAFLAGASQFIQTRISLAGQPLPVSDQKKNEKPTFQEDFSKSMQFQMKYVFPVMIGVIAYSTSAAVALYWTTSNILSIAQELYMKRGNKAPGST